METISPHERLEQDQQRLSAAIGARSVSRNPFTRGFSALRAGYLGILVEQDLEAVEVADYNATPQPRTPFEQ